MKLTIENLEKSYGRTKALAGFSYEFTPGIYGILGANGAGKSTLFGLLTDTLRRQSGQILWDGTDILKLGRNYRAKVGYMPQAQGYYPQMSAREFLYYMGEVKGLPRAARKTEAERLLKAVDLWDVADRKLGQFSGGMRQRALLAQAMLGDPELLILDEPTAGVDPRERIRIRGFIAGLARERIVLLATHVVTDVECIADQVLLMNKGELLKADRPESLIASMDDTLEQAVGNELTRQLVYEAGSSNYEYIGIDPERVCVGGAPDSDASKSLRRGLAVILAACRMTGLEQARQLGLDNLYAIADYPISATTWLVPGKDDASYRTAYDATDLTTAKQIALSCFDNAGYIVSDEAVIAAPEEASCSFEVRVMAYPDGEDGKTVCDPVYLTLLEAQSVFAELGITLDVVNTYALDNPFPQRGDSDMWASVWSQVDITGWSQEYGVQPPLYTFVDPGIQLNAVYASNGGANRYGFSDPELEEMLTEANATTDLNVRKELYQDCLERIIDWAVEVPLYQSQGAVVFNNELIDATTFPADLTASYSWLREVEHISLN